MSPEVAEHFDVKWDLGLIYRCLENFHHSCSMEILFDSFIKAIRPKVLGDGRYGRKSASSVDVGSRSDP
jgi:hypothetical protein